MPGQGLATKARYSQAQIDHWRTKLKVGKAIDTLNKVVAGDFDVTTARMKAIEITLRKTLPDLQSVELTGHEGGPISFIWGKPEESTVLQAGSYSVETDTENTAEGGTKPPASPSGKQEQPAPGSDRDTENNT